ncbi:MAG: AGE family epimerase/isomerase, partial [Clostridia bacterium]|nr:AGE family epimerase/isomerase [Clostridia bacterium]
FITKHAYAENGEWYFLLERDGSPLVTDRSVLTDMFCLMGLGAYEGARGLNPSRYFLETVSALTSKLLYSQEMSIYPQRVDLDVIAHSPFMIAVNAFSEVRSQLGDGEADVVIKYCISKIYENLYSHERGLVYESRNVISGNNIPDESAIINPGHIFESMAFMVKESKRLDMMQEYNLSLDAIQKAFEVSSDSSYGGILHMLHMDGSIGKYTDWHVERNLQSTDKVWWTHAEALYALLLLYYERRNPEVLKNFTSLFDWCEKHFWDDTVGEWNMILNQNGNKKLCLKGGLQKAAFHVPRSLYNIQALFKLLIMEIR